MNNTYTQLHVHFVFAVKYRQALLHKPWRNELFAYMAGIVRNHGHKVMIVNGVEDHVHLLVGMNTTQTVSDLMQVVKRDSSKWINDRNFCKEIFRWQESYAAFAVSKRYTHRVAKYILNQEEHHAKTTLRDEQRTLLRENEIDYKEDYLFRDPI